MSKNKHASSEWPWVVCIVLMLATFLSYLDRNAFGIVAPEIQTEFAWDNTYGIFVFLW